MYRYIIVWLLFVNVYTFCHSLKSTEDGSRFTSSTKVARHMFENCATVVVVVPNLIVMKASFLAEIDKPVEILSYNYVVNNCELLPKKSSTIAGYIFISEHFDIELYETMKCIRQSIVFPAEVNLMIIDIAQPTLNVSTKYGKFLESLWNELSLTKVVVLHVDSNTTPLPRVHIYSPFLEKLEYSQHCYNSIVNDCSKIILNISVEDSISSVMANRFKNMNGHAVHVFSVDLKDLPETHSLWMLKKELESYFNLEIIYHTFSLTTGEEILRVLDDKMTNGKVVTDETTYYVEGCMEFHSTSSSFSHPEGMKMKVRFTISMYEAPVGFLVHENPPIESWKLFFYIFQLELWICIVVAFVVLSFVWIWLKMMAGQNVGFFNVESIFQTFVLIAKTILTAPLNKVDSSYPEKMLLASCFLLGMVLMTLFTSQMFSLTMSKPRLPPINSLQEMVNYVLDSQLYVTTKYIKNVTNFFNGTIVAPLIPRLVQDNVGVGQLLDLGKLDVLEKNNNPLFIVLTPAVLAAVSKSNDSDIYLVNEAFQLVHCNLFTNFKWGKYYTLFDTFISYCFQCGLVRKWDKDYLLFNGVFDENRLKSFGKSEFNDIQVSLSYEMLIFPVYILYVGWVVSSTVFILEIFHSKLICKN